jgi:hypothetical protein
MALTAANLKLIAGGGTGNVWHYNTTDAPATVAGSGYFNSVTTNLKQYDMILVAGTTGGTHTFDLLGVTSASGAATVTTTNGT